MKKLSKISTFAIIMIGFSLNTFGQASATASVTATIIAPIAITKTGDMNFGNAAVQVNTGGTIVLTPAGSRTVTGGVTLPSVSGTVTAASFNVTGEGTSTYSITLPVGTTTLTNSGGNTISCASFTTNRGLAGTLNAGVQSLAVGATLTIPAAQPPGVYVCDKPFTVTVNYN